MRKLVVAPLRNIALVLGLSSLVSFTAFRYTFDKNELIFELLYSSLQNLHYSPEPLDDKFSNKVWDLYINTSFNKQFLAQTDIDRLEPFHYKIDDEIAQQKHDFYTATQQILDKRIREKEAWSKEILAKPMDFSVNESFETDYKKIGFAKDDAALKDQWRRWLKYQVLARLDEALTKEEKADTLGSKATRSPMDTLEADARRKVLKAQEDMFKRLYKQTPRDRFSEFANAVTGVYDPHTQYFAPKDKKRFDQGMSGQFEGIGARLMQKDGILKVSEIIVGSPSYKQGELKAGDDILKVAQGAGEPVDLTNMDMEDAIELIKGKKGTEVRLTVRKADNSVKVIPIVRDVVEIEETFAKSAVLEGKEKVGYIYLPSFYTDFTRTGAHHCSADMRKEIEKLKKQKIKGLVVDLRDNGGGSLQEVVEMAGLFFGKGPVVQVRGRNNGYTIMEDKNPDVVWDGPLTILINHNSASASEILAAAMQDYRRAVILGTTSFGKGTVQSFVDLDNYLAAQFDTIKPIGSVKITQQKFYRINGGATQLKGVTPDIPLSDPYALIDLGEKEYDNPMPWDEISKADYTAFNTINYEKLIKNSQKRTSASQAFGLIEKQSEEIKQKKDDTQYSLNLDAYRAEQKQMRDQAKKYEELRKDIKGFNVRLLDEDKLRLANDTSRLNREERWVKNIAKDVYIHEASQVIGDMQ